LTRSRLRQPPSTLGNFDRQCDPGRRVVARFLPAAHFTVHPSGDKQLRRWGIQQKMVDADAGVSSEGVAEIVPERVDGLVGMKPAQSVGSALGEQVLVCGPRLRKKQCIVHPALRLISIHLGRDDVVIASKDDWLIEFDKPFRIPRESFEPGKLVVEFRAGCRITVGRYRHPINSPSMRVSI
jgi:hypothetical protein